MDGEKNKVEDMVPVFQHVVCSLAAGTHVHTETS